MLYRGTGLYGLAIRLHTGHPIGHVEIYNGNGRSVASRDGQGVNEYPLRTADLVHILRADRPLDLTAAARWFATMKGTPYGWLDLLNFFGVTVQAKGIVCSAFAADWYRAAGLRLFNTEPARLVAPYEFLLACVFKEVGGVETALV